VPAAWAPHTLRTGSVGWRACGSGKCTFWSLQCCPMCSASGSWTPILVVVYFKRANLGAPQRARRRCQLCTSHTAQTCAPRTYTVLDSGHDSNGSHMLYIGGAHQALRRLLRTCRLHTLCLRHTPRCPSLSGWNPKQHSCNCFPVHNETLECAYKYVKSGIILYLQHSDCRCDSSCRAPSGCERVRRSPACLVQRIMILRLPF
jgi:hypothetical protein